MDKLQVTRIWILGGRLYAETTSGKEASYDLGRFRGLRNATPKQLRNFKIIGGKDIYWPELDEEINLEGMFYDNDLCHLTETEDSVVFRP